MSELRLLTQAAGSFPVRQILTKRLKPDPKLFIGSGKVEEIRAIMLQEEAQIAIFNNALSPAQQRNLERSFERHVIDRTSLILDIFALSTIPVGPGLESFRASKRWYWTTWWPG